jgi:hypothetical protein
VADFAQVAEIMHPRKKRRMSEEQHLAVAQQLQKARSNRRIKLAPAIASASEGIGMTLDT